MFDNETLTVALSYLLIQINKQIEKVTAEAKELGWGPEVMRNSDGSWVMTDLLVAKAQVLSSLVLLRTDK